MAERKWCMRPPRGWWYCVWAEGHYGECHEFPYPWTVLLTLTPDMMRKVDRQG